MLSTCRKAQLPYDNMLANGVGAATGLEMLDTLAEVLATSDVVRRHGRSISTEDILQWIHMPVESTDTVAYEECLRYDAVADMSVCCANTAEPSVVIEGANPADNKVYCRVDMKFLKSICVSQEWMIAMLKCRPEVCDSVYPPLTETESELANDVSDFISRQITHADGKCDEVMLVWD